MDIYPGYWLCIKHGPMASQDCPKCSDERASFLETVSKVALSGFDSASGKDWTGVEAIMKTPTEAQLKDPKWWDERAPTNCEKAGVGYIGDKIWSFEFMEPGTTAVIAPCNAEVRFVDRPKPHPTNTQPADPEAQISAEWDGGLPLIGQDVLSDTSDKENVRFTVKGYHVEPDIEGNQYLHRVFVDLVYFDDPTVKNCRMLHDIRPLRSQAEREKDELNQIIDAAMRSGDGDAATAIIAAGWRKGAE